MDIDLLSRIVKELITDHDKVGLPGLGTFVAEVVPASFSDKGYTINPPYRRLSFHPDNTEADLLVKFYSDSNHVPLEASRVYITEFLSELKQVLIQRKTVIFPGLGRLRATKENNFFFVPDEDLDIYPDGFGLQPVSMKYIQGMADPVDIKLSYSDAMRGFEDRHRAAEEQQAEPVQPGAEQAQHQPEAEEQVQREEEPGSEMSHAEQMQPEPGQSSEPVLPITEAQHQPEAEEQVQCEEELGSESEQLAEPDRTEPGTEPMQPEPTQPSKPEPSEMGQPAEPDHTAPAQPSEDPSEHQCDAAPAEQLQGEESDAAPAELQPEHQCDAAPAGLPGEETGGVRRRSRWWIAPVVVVSLAVVALGVFVILAHAAPDFIDSILYTPEELKILNY